LRSGCGRWSCASVATTIAQAWLGQSTDNIVFHCAVQPSGYPTFLGENLATFPPHNNSPAKRLFREIMLESLRPLHVELKLAELSDGRSAA